MTTTSGSDLVENLKRAREGRSEGDSAWANDLPELPDLPTGEERTAIFIPRKGKPEPQEEAGP